MTLLTDLRDQARRRGMLGAKEAVTLASVFRIVRDLPYLPASDRLPETVVREWRGARMEKHVLLAALFEALGYEASVMIAAHQFDAESAPWLPDPLLAQVREAPVPDVHTFLRLRHDPVADDWMTVDATWPLAARDLGLPANAALTPGVDQRIAADIEELFHVPEDEDPVTVEARIVELHVGAQAARRAVFLEALADWIATATPPTDHGPRATL